MFEQATTLTFDVVGTLIDFETGILNWWRPILQRHGVAVSDDELLRRLGEAEAELQRCHPELPYTSMLSSMYWSVSRQLAFTGTESEASAFPESIADWPAFNDSAKALKQLGERFQLAAFTNADAWACTAMSRTLEDPFDTAVTCDEVGINKPSLRFFRYGIEKLGVRPEEVVHVAQSQYHDIASAQQLGMATVWIERRHAKQGSGATPPIPEIVPADLHLTSLAGLLGVLDDNPAL